jgi:hypothetical protein
MSVERIALKRLEGPNTYFCWTPCSRSAFGSFLEGQQPKIEKLSILVTRQF